MTLTEQLDLYCERMGPDFWAEPVNAITNAAFLLAAIWAGARLRGSGLGLGWALAGLLFAIGVGSFLFHSFATTWALIADVVPIVLFILVFVFATHRDVIGHPLWLSALAVPGFLIFAAVSGAGFAALPGFAISAGYWPVVLALIIYAVALRSLPDIRCGFLIGAALLTLSLTARSLDLPVCETIPLGTHFLWHVLNGIMLAWMIEVYRRHMLAGAAARG
ncbi:MAG: hypothetical protein AAF376_15280 [Pseudomonadota bacterium]